MIGNGQAGIVTFFGFMLLCLCGLLFFFITLLIGVLEYVFGWRIKNNFFLNNGFMKFLRYFGLVCIALDWLSFVVFMMIFLIVTITSPVIEP